MSEIKRKHSAMENPLFYWVIKPALLGLAFAFCIWMVLFAASLHPNADIAHIKLSIVAWAALSVLYIVLRALRIVDASDGMNARKSKHGNVSSNDENDKGGKKSRKTVAIIFISGYLCFLGYDWIQTYGNIKRLRGMGNELAANAAFERFFIVNGFTVLGAIAGLIIGLEFFRAIKKHFY